MYDLEELEVLRGEGYRKIAHAKYSAWTHRIMSKVWGQYRAEGVQIYPSDGLHGQRGPSARLVLWRFRRVGQGREVELIAGLRKLYEARVETVQLRGFRVAPAEGGGYLAMARLSTPATVADVS